MVHAFNSSTVVGLKEAKRVQGQPGLDSEGHLGQGKEETVREWREGEK